MTEEEFAERLDALNKEKKEFLKNNPDVEPDGDFCDAHSCSMFANESGVCEYCGAVIYGSNAYNELYGGGDYDY